MQNKKEDRHRSEAEPVPVSLRTEAEAAGRRLVRSILTALPFPVVQDVPAIDTLLCLNGFSAAW